jgi:GntR family transcriptional regulator of vanillate catabolism
MQPIPTLTSVQTRQEAPISQTVHAQLRLRELILAGEFPVGSRILEIPLAERLGVSRTPVRTALVRLEQEGLLEAVRSGGFRVRQFGQHDFRDAIELRGTLEGLVARRAAERGITPDQALAARTQLRAIDTALSAPEFGAPQFDAYAQHNEAFHRLLPTLAQSPLIDRELTRVNNLPFASPSAFLGVQVAHPASRAMLLVAQDQHWRVLEAIEAREGARAESLMREHARIALRNLEHAFDPDTALQTVRGNALIRQAVP